MTALNTAFLADGAWIDIPPRVIVENPIHVLFISTAIPTAPRRCRIRECWRCSAKEPGIDCGEPTPVRTVPPTSRTLSRRSCSGENAALDHYKLQQESAQAYHVGALHVIAHGARTVASHSISLGGALVRNDVFAVLDGEGAECTLNGLYLADGQRLVDNHTTIDHAKPHCGSREIYKGILADRARGVFNGKIIVRPDAQKTDAKQTNRALLLSEDAADQHEAAARDFCERRQVHARRGCGSARRRGGVLPALARLGRRPRRGAC